MTSVPASTERRTTRGAAPARAAAAKKKTTAISRLMSKNLATAAQEGLEISDMTDRRTAIALFVLALVPYCYFYGGWGANQEVNFALTRAIVEARTLHVDDFTVHEGDIAGGVGGHIYINKPPGLSILGVVPYKIQRAVQRRGMITFADFWR